MQLKPLLKLIAEKNPNADVKIIEKAYHYAKEHHQNQSRASNEPFFVHPYEVAMILASFGSQSATICAGFLHDTVEDSSATIADIRKEFGKEIADLVEGVTKIDKIHFETRADYTAENLRKVLLATAKDVRVMLIKLADRLHNMRTLKHFLPDKQRRIAKETMDIYAPIAHKLGMWRVKGELEDLAMRNLKPATYQKIADQIKEKRAVREKATEDIISMITAELKKEGIKAQLSGRAKYFYSIYKKMQKKSVDLDEIYDLIAVRIIVETIPQCYAAMGAVHELWKPMPRRFKDYISNPKANGYQSLHTVLEGPNNKVLEVQIRTVEMDRVAEDGIAAHWKYHGTERDKKFDTRISWIKQLLRWRSDSSEARNFIESLKMDLFEDEIVTFTPKGDPINLKEGATPVDFAFEVHTYLGLKTSKALVNGKLVPLDHELQPGDIVEIIASKTAMPSRQWLNFVKTSKAKSKIRSYLNITLGSKKKEKEDKTAGVVGLAELIEIKSKKAPIKLSKCCNPKFGDEILGFYTKDNKITVHSKACLNVHSLSNTRKAELNWMKLSIKDRIELNIFLREKVGALADVLNFLAAKKINITQIQAKPTKEKQFHCSIMIENIGDRDHLLRDLRTIDVVIDAVIAEE